VFGRSSVGALNRFDALRLGWGYLKEGGTLLEGHLGTQVFRLGIGKAHIVLYRYGLEYPMKIFR